MANPVRQACGSARLSAKVGSVQYRAHQRLHIGGELNKDGVARQVGRRAIEPIKAVHAQNLVTADGQRGAEGRSRIIGRAFQRRLVNSRWLWVRPNRSGFGRG